MPNTFTVTMPTEDGDAEALFQGAAETGQGGWQINYPWGGLRFFGTIREVRKQMTADITRHSKGETQ